MNGKGTKAPEDCVIREAVLLVPSKDVGVSSLDASLHVEEQQRNERKQNFDFGHPG